MKIGIQSSGRAARVAAGLLTAATAGCSAVPREAPVSQIASPSAPEDQAIAAARRLATEQFYQGKSLALAGARESRRPAPRRGNPPPLAFGPEFYKCVPLYRRGIGAGSPAPEAERRPAE